MLAKLYNQTKLVANTRALKGKLRAYQKRGVAWLQYLEKLGLNACLADDMWLGKTIKIITLLLLDAKYENKTLLIAPTSVLSNWEKEIEKFAPKLRVLVNRSRNTFCMGVRCMVLILPLKGADIPAFG